MSLRVKFSMLLIIFFLFVSGGTGFCEPRVAIMDFENRTQYVVVDL